MDNARIGKLLWEFKMGEKTSDLGLRSKDFSDEEIGQVEGLGYIDFFETTAWGDRIYKINEQGILFRCKNQI